MFCQFSKQMGNFIHLGCKNVSIFHISLYSEFTLGFVSKQTCCCFCNPSSSMGH